MTTMLVRVAALLALLGMIPACTPAAPTAGPSAPTGHTALSTTVPASPERPSSDQPISIDSISLSAAPGTYSTVRMLLLCGQQIQKWPEDELAIYPDVPTSVTHTSKGSLIVALGADCDHGGTVSVSPDTAANETTMVAAADGKPLVVKVQMVSAGVLTFIPSNGVPARTRIT